MLYNHILLLIKIDHKFNLSQLFIDLVIIWYPDEHFQNLHIFIFYR